MKVRQTTGQGQILEMLDKGLGVKRLSRSDPASPKHKANWDEIVKVKAAEKLVRDTAKHELYLEQVRERESARKISARKISK